jgi:exodeoxyribonuclease V alpha subunit
LLPGTPERETLRVAFPRNDGSGGIRFVLPSRLPEVETVFAMTYKIQGSEFHPCSLAATTRNADRAGLYRDHTSPCILLLESRDGVFEEAVRTPVRRISGLALY